MWDFSPVSDMWLHFSLKHCRIMKINDVWDLLHVEDLIATNIPEMLLCRRKPKLGKQQDPLGSYQVRLTGEFNHFQNNLYCFNFLADHLNLYVLGQMLQKDQMCTNQNIIKLLVLNVTLKCCNGWWPTFKIQHAIFLLCYLRCFIVDPAALKPRPCALPAVNQMSEIFSNKLHYGAFQRNEFFSIVLTVIISVHKWRSCWWQNYCIHYLNLMRR